MKLYIDMLRIDYLNYCRPSFVWSVLQKHQVTPQGKHRVTDALDVSCLPFGNHKNSRNRRERGNLKF